MIAGGHGEANPNKTWVNARGFWLTYIVFVTVHHLCLLSLPFVSVPLAWTLTCLSHNLAHLYFLHSIKGAPWLSIDTGRSRSLTHWEQLDDDEQSTSARKFLTVAPIVLFLLACLYTKNDPDHFIPNFVSLIVIFLPKVWHQHSINSN